MTKADAAMGEDGSGGENRPHISAQPAVVPIGVRREPRTTIIWDAGDKIAAEVYISRNGQEEELFAKGARGAEVAGEIEMGGIYVFKLYGASGRKNLIGSASVRGVAAATSNGGNLSALTQWILVSCAAAICLGAFYIARPNKNIASKQVIISSPNRPIKIHHLVGGAALFIALDAAIFHSGLYHTILAPVSYAGELQWRVQRENQRASSGLKEVLVLGDSRILRGFDPDLDLAAAAHPGFKFINLAVRGSTPRVWFYLLREIDPDAGRYAAIVLPVEYSDSDRRIDAWKDFTEFDVRFVGPVLRYRDAFEFSSSFQGWTNRCKAFAACVFRGYAFQVDVLDLLAHPMLRLRQVKEAHRLRQDAKPPGSNVTDENLVGIVYDAKADRLRVPPHVGPLREASLRRILFPPAIEEKGHWITYRERWIGGALERYANSKTMVVLMQMPRGPIVRPSVSNLENQSTVGTLLKNDRTMLLDAALFNSLEKPEYFFDGLHLNKAGRQEFTKRLVEELIPRLRLGNG